MRLSQALPRIAAAAAAIGMLAAPAIAADQPVPALWTAPATAAPIPDVEFFMPRPIPAWQVELGARYWLASAKTAKSLFDVAGDAMVSRLTYSGMMANSGEVYGRAAFTGGFFVKGYLGYGRLSGGHLQDEDFPPFIVGPYSSTSSDQHAGSLDYASADVGYDVVRGGDFRLGAFAGYHFFNEAMNAYGCTQHATNGSVCQPAIPADVEGISQNNEWQSVRLGLEGAVNFGQSFTLSAEGAWLPYVHLHGADTHWLRIPADFTGPIPEDGNGSGYQVEAVLSYHVTPYASIGIGGRYWHMQTSGDSHFEAVVPGASPQPVDWKTDIYGGFLQADFKIGPYPLGF